MDPVCDPPTFDLWCMTKADMQLWLTAYASRQPQPTNEINALYWACSAVWAFHYVKAIPTDAECLAMKQHVFNWSQKQE